MSIIESPFHKNMLTVTSFLGGITFAALVLIIEFSHNNTYEFPHWMPLNYLEILLISTAFTSTLFILATVGTIKIAAGEKNLDSLFTKITTILADAGFYAFLIILLPLLILSFSLNGSILIFLSSITMIIILKILDYMNY